MNYQECIAYIHQTPKFARELGNDMLKKLLTHLENPQDSLRVVHIAGTNGKGSVAAMLSEIFAQAGYRCGLFTSPYIERFNERMRINGEEIPDEKLAEIISRLRNSIETENLPVSEFALDTAAAFLWFWEEKCDIVVLETGLGGRLDATNVIQNPLATVLTAIGLDHMQYLGNTIEEITKEKCGILKDRCPVVVYPLQEDAALKVIKEAAKEKNAPFFKAELPEICKSRLRYRGEEYTLSLQGAFQAYNAATVLETVSVLRQRGISIAETAVEKGLAQTKHMARFEWFGEDLLLDGGHNLPAAKALVQSLKSIQKPICFCVAMMEDKDFEGYIKEIAGIAKKVVVTELGMPRCCKAETLASAFAKLGMQAEIEKETKKAVEKAVSLNKDGIVCVCGSLYFAGEVRPYLRKS